MPVTTVNSSSPMAVSPESSIVDRFAHDLEEAGLHYDKRLVQRFVASLATKRFVILAGLSGSGKTRIAQAFSRWLGANSHAVRDLFVPGAEVPSEKVTYRVLGADQLSVLFENEGKKVLIPRELIEQWVSVIETHGFSREVPARQIRETVREVTDYSTQINSFETHLKAAAYATLAARQAGERLPRSSFHEVVAVGPDWLSRDAVVGYADALNSQSFVRTTPIVDLMLRALLDPQHPYFLILDEMNLSHVERYFADFLSAMESGEEIVLHSGDGPKSGVPPRMHVPRNLFIVGTVNVDETTYAFSRKVLDRANVMVKCGIVCTSLLGDGVITRLA